jgi:hypothetical protein
MPRLDGELEISICALALFATESFVECLQSDRGPVRLIDCEFENQILASALAGQSRVTSLKQDSDVTSDYDMAILFAALANNKSLVDLNLEYSTISDDNWTILCESLQGHPTLTSLGLYGIVPEEDQKVHRTRLLAETMQLNTVLSTIELSEGYYDQHIYDKMIHPYLEANRYRPRVVGIKKADIALRRPLLGLALRSKSVRNSSNLLWMFLSGNPDVVLQSNEDGEQVVEEAARMPVEEAARMPVEVADSAPVELAVTRNRKY